MRSRANSCLATRHFTVGLFTSVVLSSALAGCGGGVEPDVVPVENEAMPAEEPLPVRTAPAPRLATTDEVKRHLEHRLASGLGPLPAFAERMALGHDAQVDLAPGAAPTTLGVDPEAIGGVRAFASTPGALTPCMVDFNQPSGIAMMADQAHTTFTSAPHYMHWCNNNGYLVRTWPINISHYHLAPEAANTCIGTKPKIGIKSGTQCNNQVDGKFWPRIATNMGSSSGVEFWVKSAGNVAKNFDFKSMVVKSGSVEVWLLKSNGWWVWTGLVPAYWAFPQGDNAGYLDLFASGKNGTISYDNVEVAIIP